MTTKYVINLINNTMTTLTAFASRLEQQNESSPQTPSGNVVNLSKHKFTIPQFKLLNKNLIFCPTPGNYDQIIFKADIKKFTRKIKLKAHFGTTDSEEQSNEQLKKEFYIKNPNSTWEPVNNHHTVKSFIEAVNNDIDKLPQKSI